MNQRKKDIKLRRMKNMEIYLQKERYKETEKQRKRDIRKEK